MLITASAGPARASVLMLNFEDLPDAYFFSAGAQNIGNYYPEVTFGPYVTALSVSRFGGYGDAAFPPHSGDVDIWSAYDDPLTISLASTADIVSFWYTSLNPISLTAYDSASNQLGVIYGGANTDGTTGTSSLLEFDGAGIASVSISSAAGQYVIDDLTVDTATDAPEPESFLFGLLGLATLGILARRRWQAPAPN
jgi:hypothetical protein